MVTFQKYNDFCKLNKIPVMVYPQSCATCLRLLNIYKTHDHSCFKPDLRLCLLLRCRICYGIENQFRNTHTHTHTPYTHRHLPTPAQQYTHSIYTHICTPTHTYTHIRTHTYLHTHTHTHHCCLAVILVILQLYFSLISFNHSLFLG